MAMLSRAYSHHEKAAFAHLESVVWPDGPECPRCGNADRLSKMTATPEKRVRSGLHACGVCKKQFTVRVGTVVEASKVELHEWLQAVYLMTSGRKGVSAHRLHRALEVTYKTAWFMAHRIREARREGDLAPRGVDGGIVEAAETFIGHAEKRPAKGVKKGRGWVHEHDVLSLVERDSGKAQHGRG